MSTPPVSMGCHALTCIPHTGCIFMGGTRQPEVAIISDEYYVKQFYYCGEVIEDRSDGKEHPAVEFSYSDEDCHPY